MANDLAIQRWHEHQQSCKHCQQADENKSATLAKLCGQGGVLIKPFLESLVAPEVAAKRYKENVLYKQMMGTNYCSAARMKKLMRYK